MRRTIARRHASNDAAPVLVESTITRGLQLLLPFAERAGTTAFDLATKKHGTLVSNPTRVWSNQLGRWACSVSGGNYVYHPRPLLSVGAFSYSIWANATNTGDIAGRWQTTPPESPTGNPFREFLVRRSVNALQCFVNQANGPSYTPSSWTGHHHIAVTANGTTVRLYWDGVEVGTPASISGSYGTVNSVWYVGDGHNSGNLAGSLADPCIWSRTLSPAEIRWLANPRNSLYGPPQLSRPWATELGGEPPAGSILPIMLAHNQFTGGLCV